MAAVERKNPNSSNDGENEKSSSMTSSLKQDSDDNEELPTVNSPRALRIVWTNVGYMGALHLGSIYALYLVFKINLWTMLFYFIIHIMAGLGVTAGAHRLWSHKTYKAKWPLRLMLMIFNCFSAQNSIYDWSRDHRVHHKYSDTDADPHNINRGFFFSHVGWLLVRKHPEVIKKGKTIDMSDLKADPIVTFQKRFFVPLMFLFNIGLPTVIPSLWGESMWNAYFVCFILRYVSVLNITWCVNSAAHKWGNKPYDTSILPSENMFVALTALGEGFHNYHHTFPYDYRTSEFGLKLNATTAFIHFMVRIGWAYDLRAASKELVEKRMLRTGIGRHG